MSILDDVEEVGSDATKIDPREVPPFDITVPKGTSDEKLKTIAEDVHKTGYLDQDKYGQNLKLKPVVLKTSSLLDDIESGEVSSPTEKTTPVTTEPKKSSPFIKFMEGAGNALGDQTPPESLYGDTSSLRKGTMSAATGLASYIPAGLSMSVPTLEELSSWLFPAETAGRPLKTQLGERAERSKGVQETFTYTPKDKEAQRVAEVYGRPFTWLADKGHESEKYWLKKAETADMYGDNLTSKYYNAVAFLSGFGGEALPFIAPYGFKAVKGGIKDVWNDLPRNKRIQVVSAVDNMRINLETDKLTPKQVRELWKNGDAATRDSLRNRYTMGREANPKADTTTPESMAPPEPKPETILASGASEQAQLPLDRMGRVVAEHPVTKMVKDSINFKNPLLPSPPNLGEGFTMVDVPPVVKKIPSYTAGQEQDIDVDFNPTVQKNGNPFATETAALRAAEKKGISAKLVEIVKVSGGFGYKRPGIPSQKTKSILDEIEQIDQAETAMPKVSEFAEPPAPRMINKTAEEINAEGNHEGLTVAMRDEGEVYTGEPGNIHADVIEANNLPWNSERGWVDKKGNFIPADQAAAEARVESIFAEGKKARELAESERSKSDPAVEYKRQAEEAGVSFDGMQERPGKPPIPTFRDPETNANIYLNEGENLPEAVARKRAEFKATEEPEKKLVPAIKVGDEVYIAEVPEGSIHGMIWNDMPDFAKAKAENTPPKSGWAYPDKTGFTTEKPVQVEPTYTAGTPVVNPKIPRTEAKKTSIPVEQEGKLVEQNANAAPVKTDITIYSGIPIHETLNVLRDLKANAEEAIPYLESIGKRAYENGKQTFKDWSSEMQRVLGDLWGKFTDFLKDIYYSFEEILNNERGDTGGLYKGEKIAKHRIIRKSEKTKLNKAINKHEIIQDKIRAELSELTGKNGTGKFEELKAKRIAEYEQRLARLKSDAAKFRREGWQKAIETVKKKEYNSHVKHLEAADRRLSKTIDRLKTKAETTYDKNDVLAPVITVPERDAVMSLPDMDWKPAGGITQNPIYTLEAWGRNLGDKGKKVKELFYYPVREATDRADRHFASIHKQSEALEKSLPSGSSKRIYLHALAQQGEHGAAILKEMGIDKIPTLTPEEMKAYNWMRRGFEVLYDKINTGRCAAGLDEFGKVDNYFTFGRELSMSELLGFGIEDPFLSDYLHPKGPAFKAALRRVGGLKKAKLDAFNIFNMYVQSAVKHMYLSPEIAKMRELTGKFELDKVDSIGRKYKESWKMQEKLPRSYKMLTDYIDFVAGKKKRLFPRNVERVVDTLGTNITFATLSGNMRSASIQPTALLNTYVEIGPKYTVKGVADLFTDERYKAMQKSLVLFNREFDVNVKPTMEGALGKVGKAREAFNKSWLGMKTLKALDMETATATWLGAYEKGKTVDGLSEKDAIYYADDVVIKTQGSAAKQDIAPIQRSTVGKFFTTFQTFVINNWNWLCKEVAGLKNADIKNPAAVKKVLRYVIGAALINTFFEDILGWNSPLPSPIGSAYKAYNKQMVKNLHARKEENKKSPLRVAAFTAGLEFLQLIPGLGNARYGSSFLGAPTEFIGDVSSKLAAESGMYNGFTPSWLEIGGKTMGLPGTVQARKAINFFAPSDSKVKRQEREKKQEEEYDKGFKSFDSGNSFRTFSSDKTFKTFKGQ